MVVVHIIRNAAVGGAERIALALLRGQRQAGIEAHLVALYGGDDCAALTEAQIKVLYPGRLDRNRFGLIHTASKLRQFLDSLRADVVFAHAPRAALAYALSGVKQPAIWALQGQDICWQPKGMSNRLARRLQRWAMPHFSAAVACSAELSEAASSGLGFPPDRFRVIQLGIDTDNFSFISRSPGRQPVIATLGRLIPLKGHRRALAAFSLLLKEYPHAKLWIIGDGPSRFELEREAAFLNIGALTTFWGMRQSPVELLKKCDVLWQPSDREGLPLSCMEALATGLPVLGFDVPGVRYVLSGGAGRVVPPYDCGALCAATLVLLRDPVEYARTAQNARRIAVQRFSERRMFQEYNLLIDSFRKSNDDSGQVHGRAPRPSANAPKQDPIQATSVSQS